MNSLCCCDLSGMITVNDFTANDKAILMSLNDCGWFFSWVVLLQQWKLRQIPLCMRNKKKFNRKESGAQGAILSKSTQI